MRLWLAVFALLLPVPVAAATVVASSGDAYVIHDEAADVWTVGSNAVAVSLGFGRARDLQLLQVANPTTGRQWDLNPGSDTVLTIDGTRSPLSASGTGLTFSGVTATEEGGGVRLVFAYTRADLRVQILRYYACYPQSPVVETWTRVESSGATHAIAITAATTWQATIAPGTLRWLNGLQDATANASNDDAFQPQVLDLAAGQTATIGSNARSTDQVIPILMIDGPQDEFIVGSIWSGSWQIAASNTATGLAVTLSYPGFATTVSDDRPLELPHGFFGVSPGNMFDVNAALRPFIINGLRQGRSFSPLVTYNTWFAYGVELNQDDVAREIQQNAALGVELFVLDAGWNTIFDHSDTYDFEASLGTWEADPLRFPDGIRPLRDLAHSYGMKFGIWVEPERVNRQVIGTNGLQESWLAKHDGNYELPATGQICLAGKAGHDWVLQRLTSMIDDIQPDYVKWDNNAWVNCNRDGHGHGKEDGSFGHVQGLYDILAQLRDRYPDLLIENVSGGGNRLDFGWLRYSDAAWMDDKTSPSTHVRHDLEGLGTVFPPTYLLSFAIDDATESLFGGDVPLYLRSRSIGILGMTYVSDTLPNQTIEALRAGIATYKEIRAAVSAPELHLLTDLADITNPDRWDAVEELDPVSRNVVAFAFRGGTSPNRFTVQFRNLEPDTLYRVWTVDRGELGVATGESLMDVGVEVGVFDFTSGHVLIVRPDS